MGYFLDFFSLIYPRICVACGRGLFKHESSVCTYCFLNLPRGNYHLYADNELARVFYGRVPVEQACAYYQFEKSTGVQKILHSIKYKGNDQLARQTGKWFASEINPNTILNKADFLLPVPLHPKKLRQRGFNQSEEFAKGISEIWNLPIAHNLRRKTYTATQTLKRKFERWENVNDQFELFHPEELEHKSIVLVDDVITTGATIEACYMALKNLTNTKINVMSLAFAKKA